jgi:putative glutamine amidotransferase
LYFEIGAPAPPPEDGTVIRLIKRPPEGWPPRHYLVGKGAVPAGKDGEGVDGHEAYLPLARECLEGGISGLILSGGGDVGADPRVKPGLQPVLALQDKARDRWEAALFFAAMEAGLPVLGVCRGLQLMNVAMGGTLWEDIANIEGAMEHVQHSARTGVGHTVALAPGSLAARIMGPADIGVNSGHHQAIRTPAPGLSVTGTAPDGIIEVMEVKGKEFGIGVQWHPEGLARTDPRALALFKALAEEARKYLPRRDGASSGKDGKDGRSDAGIDGSGRPGA